MLKDKINWLVESWTSKEYVEHITEHKENEPSEGLTDWHHKVLDKPNHEHIMNDAIKRQQKLSKGDSNAVADYQTDSSRYNSHIRGNKSIPEELREHVSHLDGVTNNRLKHDTVVYRGLHKDFKHLPVGSEFKDKGFTGTSIDEDIGKNFGDVDHDTKKKVVARIFLEAGQDGAYLPHSKPKVSNKDLEDDASIHDDEHEFLLPRHTRFKVIGHSTELAKHNEHHDTHYVNLEVH
jgi:hypothetical protein